MNTKTLNTLLAGAVAVSALGFSTTSASAMNDTGEKCYGVVKTGMNGCGSADKAHGCAGMATTDASGVEWVSLPKGTCEKLAGGSLEPVMPEEAPEEQ
tara:strand:+ start:528 stop:821 length:294 start_codon:yes stop_codon:yes gene_type:complete